MMGPLEKLRMLSEATQYEPAEDVSLTGDPLPKAHAPEELIGCISHAATPKGRVPLLKTLVSSACERNCNYCAFRSGRNFQRASFTPEELAYLFLQIYEAGLVKGIFLSSGMIGGGPKTQDRILETAAILRQHHRFTGYLHLKIMPGAERDQIAAGMALADRVSLNLEAPNARRLTTLAPKKGFDDELLTRLTWVHELRQSMRPHTSPSMTTQFVVGAAGESDVELLLTTEQLTRRLGLARAYFSIFSPVPDTPLEMLPPASLTRQRRLYQASFLLRDYGFAAEELPFAQDGNLPLETDPKLVWAEHHLSERPVEINQADREMLLRIPGIGIKGVERILEARRTARLHDLSQLHKLGISTKRAAPFVLLDGRRPARQLSFWTLGALNSPPPP